MKAARSAAGRFANRHALACARRLTTEVHSYRRVLSAREAMPQELREAFDAVAVRRISATQFAKLRGIPLDRARGRFAAALALLNGELGLPVNTEIIS